MRLRSWRSVRWRRLSRQANLPGPGLHCDDKRRAGKLAPPTGGAPSPLEWCTKSEDRRADRNQNDSAADDCCLRFHVAHFRSGRQGDQWWSQWAAITPTGCPPTGWAFASGFCCEQRREFDAPRSRLRLGPADRFSSFSNGSDRGNPDPTRGVHTLTRCAVERTPRAFRRLGIHRACPASRGLIQALRCARPPIHQGSPNATQRHRPGSLSAPLAGTDRY